MRTRNIALLATLLTLAGCHHRNNLPEVPADSTPYSSNVQVTELPEEGEPASRVYQVSTDTATRVDLKAFSRRQKVIYSHQLLVGRWLRGSLYEEYDANGLGHAWDTADDVTREEANLFYWSMDSNLLHVEYPIKMGGIVPRDYLVTFADEESLVYKDEFGTSYMLDKVEQ